MGNDILLIRDLSLGSILLLQVLKIEFFIGEAPQLIDFGQFLQVFALLMHFSHLMLLFIHAVGEFDHFLYIFYFGEMEKGREG